MSTQLTKTVHKLRTILKTINKFSSKLTSFEFGLELKVLSYSRLGQSREIREINEAQTKPNCEKRDKVMCFFSKLSC